MPVPLVGIGRSVTTVVPTRAIETTTQNKKSTRTMRVTLVLVIGVSPPTARPDHCSGLIQARGENVILPDVSVIGLITALTFNSRSLNSVFLIVASIERWIPATIWHQYS